MTVVARATGQPWWAVARAPFHETLLTYGAIREQERIDALVGEGRDLMQATRVNWAWANPDALRDAHDRYELRLAGAEGRAALSAPTMTRDEFAAHAAALYAEFYATRPPLES